MLLWGFMSAEKLDEMADYTKYLGPSWDPSKAKFTGAGSYVCNHQSGADIVISIYLNRPVPGFIAKSEILDLWGFGSLA